MSSDGTANSWMVVPRHEHDGREQSRAGERADGVATPSPPDARRPDRDNLTNSARNPPGGTGSALRLPGGGGRGRGATGRGSARPPAASGIGMLRVAEHVLGRAGLDDLAEIHDGDAVADLLHHRHVVRDEEVGEAQLGLQLLQELQDLRLDRDVERGDAFVGDDDLRVEAERAGDADALALAAGEFVRIARDRVRASGRRAGTGRRRALSVPTPMPRPWITSGSPTRSPTFMRGSSEACGSWKIICTSRRTARMRIAGEARRFLARDLHRAGERREMHDGARGGRFAAAAFADQRQGLARHEVEGDLLDRMDALPGAVEESAFDVEAHDQVAHRQSRLRSSASAGGAFRPAENFGTAASSALV